LESWSRAIVIIRAVSREGEHFRGALLRAASARWCSIAHSVTTRRLPPIPADLRLRQSSAVLRNLRAIVRPAWWANIRANSPGRGTRRFFFPEQRGGPSDWLQPMRRTISLIGMERMDRFEKGAARILHQMPSVVYLLSVSRRTRDCLAV